MGRPESSFIIGPSSGPEGCLATIARRVDAFLERIRVPTVFTWGFGVGLLNRGIEALAILSQQNSNLQGCRGVFLEGLTLGLLLGLWPAVLTGVHQGLEFFYNEETLRRSGAYEIFRYWAEYGWLAGLAGAGYLAGNWVGRMFSSFAF